MKITKKQLKQIIKEEINTALNETRLTPEQLERIEDALGDAELKAYTEAARSLASISRDSTPSRYDIAAVLVSIFNHLGHKDIAALIPSLPSMARDTESR